MPKWERSKQDDRRQIQGVEDGRYIGHAIIPADADAICRAHNADIDALTAERDALARRINTDGAPVDVAALCLEIDEATAERDELQRRLGAVVAKISEAVVSDDDCVCSMLCYSAIIAIAEGRDNG